MRKTALISFATVVILTGCAPAGSSFQPTPPLPVQTTHENIERLTRISHDRHENITRARAPELDRGNTSAFLRAWKRPEQKAWSTQVYVTVEMSDWAFLDRAYSNGVAIDVTRISSDIIYCGSYTGCTLWESVGLNITPSQLRALAVANKPFEAKVMGSHGSAIVHIPASYISGFIAALDDEQS